MADLRNSQRISYKATYNQISPTPVASRDGNPPPKSLLRAIEKTAFVQSLKIVPHELPILRDRMSRGAASAVTARLPPALAAIEKLISDTTATSTLNNAVTSRRSIRRRSSPSAGSSSRIANRSPRALTN